MGFKDVMGKMGSKIGKGVVNALTPNFAKKIWNGIKAFLRFIRSGIGIIVLKILLVVFVLINLWVIIVAILDEMGLDGVLGLPSIDDERGAVNLQFLSSVNNMGTESIINADQVIDYYSFEYYVLMDCAEYLERVGVTPVYKADGGVIEWKSLNREQWAMLVANAFSESKITFDKKSAKSTGLPVRGEQSSAGGSGTEASDETESAATKKTGPRPAPSRRVLL